MAIDPRVRPQGQRLPPQMSQVDIPPRPMPQGGAPLPQNMRGGVGMVPPGAMPAAGMPPRPIPQPQMAPVPAGALKKGGAVKKYADGGIASMQSEKKDKKLCK